ncbi:hypothetical protein G7007_04485 [Pseudomonas entomophila]|uniref:hypothetical protein n=1 Tax=Pseudomonas entomophila TaxID=312306 RepID=UPI0015E447BB|nr:hypothetical protein [Pseudomonas entomophila]MBA1192123.1 hypothetical protein [Pseudomonas entomophila]
MSNREQIMPDHPLYLQARGAHRDYLEAKERGDPAAAINRLRLIYEAQMKAAIHYHMHAGTAVLPVQ